MIAPVADTSEHRLWLRDFPSANWDMVAIYYGSNATTFVCEECLHVEANRGPKWQVVYQFTQGEAFKKLYSKQYQQVGRAHLQYVVRAYAPAAGAGRWCSRRRVLWSSASRGPGIRPRWPCPSLHFNAGAVCDNCHDLRAASANGRLCQTCLL